ncbi:MAG TPA: ATP-dependent RNA helicase HrpA [Kineosporiaceae bacterium]|nr:ATP-dependent RNA helicase HrpA [Kineosporiaceae bacterium]
MSTQSWESSIDELRAALPDLSLRDELRLSRRLDGLLHRGRRGDSRRKVPDSRSADPEQELNRIAAEVESGRVRMATRRASVPQLKYPPELPVSQRKDDLLAAIRDHQVVILAGETGSGKTTQLPKICLELGRGVRGLIGHTQPRRLAARSVAERIAEEVGSPLGETIGYTVRFTDQVSDGTLVKLMTDGILLAEIQRDRMLTKYDTLIIDEAHERSLTIDFLLGYLKQLLPRRPDLKVIITSATIDPQAFSRHFDDAPIVEVSGRTYPVEVRYRPLVITAYNDTEDEEDEEGVEVVRDQIQAVCEAVEELQQQGDGDILVFFSGEREIRDAADALRKSAGPTTEIVPLYARLSAAEQHKVFAPHAGRRVVLATNVAETSLTVPGIRYVVDPGTARISRYSYRTKVQRLPIEPISQASANQRKGRCGRLSDGICIRLYSEEDFEARPAFTDPEILRTNLASVILQMTALGLGEVSAFPFLEPPDPRQIKDGVALLHELNALDPTQEDPRKRLTPLGRTLAQLPVDPRLARMLVEADRNGCLPDVLVIVSALSIQDPRERPTEHQQAADQSHARFKDPRSDFLSYLNLWNYLITLQRDVSSSRFRRQCIAEYLHHQRIREWQDLHGQLRQVLRSAGITSVVPSARASAGAAAADRGSRATVHDHGNELSGDHARLLAQAADDDEDSVVDGGEPVDNATADRIHISLLTGLLSQIGLKEGETREYLGARGARFTIQPGSALVRATPRWVMVGELVETTRLWGRTAARIDPLWVERLAEHLVKRSYSEPRWERKRGSAVATERVTLYGIPVIPGRTVQYGRVDPELSRELFIRHALVEGDWRTNHPFFHENRRLLEDVENLEDRVRRRDILVDDETLFDFYDQRVPADIVSTAHFDSWWKSARKERPDLLSFWTSMLFSPQAPKISEEDYPSSWPIDELELPVTYQFEPGAAADGVTVHLPLAVLNEVSGEDFEWQIPGLREELVTELIRGLPKQVRRMLVPAPERARQVLGRLKPGTEPLLPALERELAQLSGVSVSRSDWAPERVPEHLRVTFQVEAEDGTVLGAGKDLGALRESLKPRLREAISDAVAEVERTGLTSWTIGELPRSVERTLAGLTVHGFPALIDRGTTVDVRVLDSAADQRAQMRAGTRRLLLLGINSPARSVLGRLTNQQKLALAQAPHKGPSALFDDCLGAAVDALVDQAGGAVWDAAGFESLQRLVRASIERSVTEVVTTTAAVLALARDVDLGLRSTSSPALLASLADLRAQLAGLVYPGFVTATGATRLPDLLRYLQAMQRRLEKLPERYQRDQTLLWNVQNVQQDLDAAVAAMTPARRRELAEDVQRIRWMIEELRVSLFGSGMKTAYPISEQRIQRTIHDLGAVP